MGKYNSKELKQKLNSRYGMTVTASGKLKFDYVNSKELEYADTDSVRVKIVCMDNSSFYDYADIILKEIYE